MNREIPVSSFGEVRGIRPVFVSGLYRSSATFLAGVIGCHPDYQATSSLVKFLRFCLDRYNPIEQPENYRRLVQETFTRVNTRWKVSFDVAAAIAAAERAGVSYASLYNAIMSQILVANGAGGAQWIEKIAVMWSRAPDFLRMFPDGKVIHVLRDPRSVTASYKKMTSEPGYTYLDAAFNTVHSIQSIQRYREDFGGDRVMMVRAEDVTLQPEPTIREICRFLGVDFSDRMLQPDTYGRILGEEWKGNTSFGGKTEGFSPPSTQWRIHMSPAETMFVEMICQPYLAECGYQADNHLPRKQDWEEMYSFLEDPFLRERFARWLHTGRGSEGYRTDPYLTEMKIVFPERFGE